MNETAIDSVRRWLSHGVGVHRPALDEVEADGYATIHLEELLQAPENAVSEWELAEEVFDAIRLQLGSGSAFWVVMLCALQQSDEVMSPQTLERLVEQRRSSPTYYIARPTWWVIADEELHRFPLIENHRWLSEPEVVACYEVVRPKGHFGDTEEYYPSLVVRWMPRGCKTGA